jgi:hypothetical protein
MKNTKMRKMTEKNDLQCSICHANFEVWVDNLKIDPEKEEKLQEHLLSYCPVCARKGEKN